jgi:hypothetical protein
MHNANFLQYDHCIMYSDHLQSFAVKNKNVGVKYVSTFKNTYSYIMAWTYFITSWKTLVS